MKAILRIRSPWRALGCVELTAEPNQEKSVFLRMNAEVLEFSSFPGGLDTYASLSFGSHL